MINYTLESFIDDSEFILELAEESAIGDINKKFKATKERIKDIIIEIHKNKDDPKKQIELYKEIIKILDDAESEIKMIEPSKGEIRIRMIIGIVLTFVPLLIEVIHGIKTGRMHDTPDVAFIARLYAEVGVGGGVGLSVIMKKDSKKIALDFIKNEKSVCGKIIMYLENHSKSPANEGFISNIKEKHARAKQRRADLKKSRQYSRKFYKKANSEFSAEANNIAEKILKDLYEKVKSELSKEKNKCTIEFVDYDNSVEIYGASDEDSDFKKARIIMISAVANTKIDYAKEIEKYELKIQHGSDTGCFFVFIDL